MTQDSAADSQSLISRFLESTGFPAEDAAKSASFEFVSGDHVATVALDPANGGLLTIEIALRGLALADAAPFANALLTLHRLNTASRFQHPWVVSIDQDDMLLVSAAFSLQGMDSFSLEKHVLDGLERAGAVDAIWKKMTGSEDKKTGESADNSINPLEIA